MNILWFLDKEFDSSLSNSGRLATLKYLENNNNFIIVTHYRKEKKIFKNIKGKFIYTKKIDLPFIKTIYIYLQHLTLLKKISLSKIDIVFLNSSNVFLMRKLKKIKQSYNIKLIFDLRSLPVSSNYLKKKLKAYFLKKCLQYGAIYFDGITYITDEMRRYCEMKYNLAKHKTAIWSSGVDIDLFKPLNSFCRNSKFRVMYHGAVNKRRGIVNIIKAFDRLRNYDIEFFLLGSGKEIPKLKRLVYKLKLDKKVMFQKPVPHKDVARYISTADVGILPFPNWIGWNASSPIKLFEYLACEKPIIVTKIPAHKNVLNNKGFAYWALSSDPENIAEAILKAYKDKKRLQELGKEARNFVMMNFTWEKQISALEKFLRDI